MSGGEVDGLLLRVIDICEIYYNLWLRLYLAESDIKQLFILSWKIDRMIADMIYYFADDQKATQGQKMIPQIVTPKK